MIGLIILAVAIIFSLVWLWAGGIIYMHKHHKDYKGEDFLNWGTDEEDKDQIS